MAEMARVLFHQPCSSEGWATRLSRASCSLADLGRHPAGWRDRGSRLRLIDLHVGRASPSHGHLQRELLFNL